MDYLRGGVICFLYVYLGKDSRINDKTYNLILWFFSITVVGVATYFVFFNIGGIIIDSSYGREIGKNSFGPLLCYVFIIMFYQMVQNKTVFFKVVAVSMCVFSFIAICVLRSRTSMVVCLCILPLLLQKLMTKNFSKFLLYIFVVLFCIFIIDGLFGLNFVNKTVTFLTDAFTVGHERDLTSGREVRNDVALSIIRDNISYGNIDLNVQIEWVHNYFLYVLSSWGLIGGFPLLLLYIYLWIYVLKNVLTKPFALRTIGYFLMMVPLITSFSESTYPLYPGTTLFVAYFSLGFAINNR